MAESPQHGKTGGRAKRPSRFIAITGGYGAGKSAVAAIVAERYPVLSSDKIAKEVMQSDPVVRAAVRKLLGEGSYSADGTLNRRFIADAVFQNADLLERLNTIVHPAVRSFSDRRRAELEKEGHRMVFLESALVFEVKMEGRFDYIIAVIADEECVLSRLTASGIPEPDIRRRLQNQLKPQEKASRADFVIRNNGGKEELERATLFILSLVESLCAKT